MKDLFRYYNDFIEWNVNLKVVLKFLSENIVSCFLNLLIYQISAAAEHYSWGNLSALITQIYSFKKPPTWLDQFLYLHIIVVVDRYDKKLNAYKSFALKMSIAQSVIWSIGSCSL